MSPKDKHLTQFDFGPLNKRPGPEISVPRSSPNDVPGARLKKTKIAPRKVITGSTKGLALHDIVDGGNRAYKSLVIRKESPWETYRKVYDDELAGSVTVVVERNRPSTMRVVRTYTGKHKDGVVVQGLEGIQHDNIISIGECFEYQNSIYILQEHLPLSLDNLVACPAYPTEIQLASILGQLLQGLSYIATNGFGLKSLKCSNILLGFGGEVKIGKLEQCHPRSEHALSQDMKALGTITMELMERDAGEDGVIGIKDLERWPPNSDAVHFLSATTSATSLAELTDHPLLTKHRWNKGELVWLVIFALKSSWNSCSLSFA